MPEVSKLVLNFKLYSSIAVSKNSLEVMQILDQINQRGITVIVSTHDQNMVDYFRKRVITLDEGEVIRDVQAGTYE